MHSRAFHSRQCVGTSTSYACAPARLSLRGALAERANPRRAVVVRAEPDVLGKLRDRSYLEQAAKRFNLGLQNGLEEDDLIALEFGVGKKEECTDLQLQYFDKIKDKLVQTAEELERKETEMRERLAKNLELGKKAYEYGEYPTAVKLLEEAVEQVGERSQMGGEAQLWLALSYQACGREQEAIETCKYIETTHPFKKTRKQAEEIRYILEAPKLVIGEDERVKIPLLQTDSWRKDGRKMTSTLRKPGGKKEVKETYWDRVSWDMPAQDFIPDKWYVRVAWGVLLLGTTIYANMAAQVR